MMDAIQNAANGAESERHQAKIGRSLQTCLTIKTQANPYGGGSQWLDSAHLSVIDINVAA
jgi:hypothetical protein